MQHLCHPPLPALIVATAQALAVAEHDLAVGPFDDLLHPIPEVLLEPACLQPDTCTATAEPAAEHSRHTQCGCKRPGAFAVVLTAPRQGPLVLWAPATHSNGMETRAAPPHGGDPTGTGVYNPAVLPHRVPPTGPGTTAAGRRASHEHRCL